MMDFTDTTECDAAQTWLMPPPRRCSIQHRKESRLNEQSAPRLADPHNHRLEIRLPVVMDYRQHVPHTTGLKACGVASCTPIKAQGSNH